MIGFLIGVVIGALSGSVGTFLFLRKNPKIQQKANDITKVVSR